MRRYQVQIHEDVEGWVTVAALPTRERARVYYEQSRRAWMRAVRVVETRHEVIYGG